MKYIQFWVLLLLMNTGYAQKQSTEDLTIEVWQGLLDENRVSQLAFNQMKAKMDYRKRQVESKRAMVTTENVDSLLGGTASISGTVQVNSVDVENVLVTLCQFNTNNCFTNVVTDQFGVYTFLNLIAGDYIVVANDSYDDYINAIWTSTGTEFCHYCQADANNQISLAESEIQSGIDLDLTIGATVSGQVTETASAVMGIYVNINSLVAQQFAGSAMTDGSGNYTIKGLPADDFYLTIQNTQDIYIDAMWSDVGTVQCSYCIPDANSTLTLAAAEVRAAVNFNLTIGASLTGQVTDEDTLAGLETLDVQLYDTSVSGNNWYFTSVFDGSGNYTVSGIPAGSFKVYLEPRVDENNLHIPEIYNNIQCNDCYTLMYNGSGATLNLVNGSTTANIDFALEVGASFSGFIVDNNNIFLPMTQYGLILLFDDSNRLLASRYLYGTQYDPMATGAYTLGGLLPGMYFAQGGDAGRQFYQRELYENKHCPWSGCDRGGGGDPVVLGDNEQKLGINFLLNYGGKISGTVTDSMTGLPIENTDTQYLQFYDSMGDVAGGAFIRPDGTYISARAIPAGSYSVRTGTMFNGVFNSPYVMEKYAPAGNIDCPGVTCDLTAGNVTVTAYNPLNPTPEASATVTGIDFALTPAFSFTGTITEIGSANPIPDVHVLVYNSNGDFANWATTDATGDFTVYGLPAGTYYALTNNGSNLPFMGLNQTVAGGWIDILFDGTPCPGSACDVTTGDPIVLGPVVDSANNPMGSSYNFGMNAGGTITGQVRNFSNQMPASGVQVNVYHSNGDFFGSYQSDSNGYYMTVGFPAGTYYLTTANNGALLDAKYGGGYCLDQSCNPLEATPIVIVGNEAIAGADFELKPDYIFKTGLE